MTIYQLHDAALSERPVSNRRRFLQKYRVISGYDEPPKRYKEKENKQIFNPLGKRFGR